MGELIETGGKYKNTCVDYPQNVRGNGCCDVAVRLVDFL